MWKVICELLWSSVWFGLPLALKKCNSNYQTIIDDLLYSQPIKLVSNNNRAFGFGLASREHRVAPFSFQFLMWIVVLGEVSSFFCLFDVFLFGFFRFSSKELWLECHLSVKWTVDTAGCHLATLLSGRAMMAWRINKHSGVYKKGAPFPLQKRYVAKKSIPL